MRAKKYKMADSILSIVVLLLFNCNRLLEVPVMITVLYYMVERLC